MTANRFVKVSDEKTSKQKRERIFSKDLRKPLCVSRFYSQLYALFGEPDEVFYEGFNYFIKDQQSNECFWAELTGFGPGYFGNPESESAKAAVEAFDAYLETVQLKDCRIEIENDFGITVLGAKNGVPFEEDISQEGD